MSFIFVAHAAYNLRMTDFIGEFEVFTAWVYGHGTPGFGLNTGYGYNIGR